MNNLKQNIFITISLFMVSATISCNIAQEDKNLTDSPGLDKAYFAVEINNVICGYSESSETPIKKDGKDLINQEVDIFVMLSILGSEFNTEINAKSTIDPETRKASAVITHIKQGSTDINIELKVNGNKATINSPLIPQLKEIDITPETVIGSDEMFTRLKKDFSSEGKTKVSYNILELMDGEVQTSDFKKTGEETLSLVDRSFNTTIIEQTNTKTGMKTTYWLSPDFDYFVQFQVLNRKIYLSDQGVIDRIKVANMDENFVTKTNVAISDVQSLSYMKVDAVIEPIGQKFTHDDLTVPGQKFTGTVKENHIEGTFEISHTRYDGNDAPPFPPDFNDLNIKQYLTADGRIESDDPVLIQKANEITSGSQNSWEAAIRLSKWVAENIHYAIPGGGTARKTYDIRAGECGAHSFLLASFCRAVGIPARVVWGAMYVPNYGGGFGQHGWNEIYMGNAGWIQVDATALEPDYVDAGHIRISEYQSASSNFNGKKFDIIDYKLGDKQTETTDLDLEEYFGKYSNLESGKTFDVLDKEGNLAVDIPGNVVLPFNLPADDGKWSCKLSPAVYLEFTRDEDNKVNQMLLHEIAQMIKQSPPDTIDPEVPEDMKPYLGNYLFAAINQVFTVSCKDNTLVVHDPTKNEDIKLQPPNEEGGWWDEFNKNIIYFDKDEKGNVTTLKVDVANKFKKGELASNRLEEFIRNEGIEIAKQKYQLLLSEDDPNLIFSEGSLNLLGYKFMNEGKINEAVEIFEMNVEAYPESFNVYGSLAEAYLKMDNKEEAIKNYKKSLELNPENEHAKKMLKQIEGQ